MPDRLEEDDAEIPTFSVRAHWHVFIPEQLGAEVTPHGLRVAPGDPAHGVRVITRDA